MRRALLSVTDKQGISEFAKGLVEAGAATPGAGFSLLTRLVRVDAAKRADGGGVWP